ncbi:serine/threonine protein kinase [Pendulispora rubella]|uniref:Serine/threonine protein kinase n=1 Tax=Pendulispora rubella TaxID=2741070 RepID=A0ABZ2KVY4_9BACT
MAVSDPRNVARVEHRIGRYEMYGEIASGGMATVYFGRLVGDAGFVRTVAIKRLHPHYAKIPQFSSRFVEEAHLAARIRHPNVVATLDTVAEGDELLLVMEYVPGQSLAELQRACRESGERIPVGVALRLAADALYGLHAAHTATDEALHPLFIVHRDVSPQNILVGVDGMARVLDFGIAKARTSVDTTQQGQLKGKLRYMSPEQVFNDPISARTDVYALSVVLWEMLTGDPLFAGSNDAATLAQVLSGVVRKPSLLARQVPPQVDDIVLRGLQRDPSLRFESAHDMAVALESVMVPALPREVSQWMQRIAAGAIAWRAQAVAAIERSAMVERPVTLRAPKEAPSAPAPAVSAHAVSAHVPIAAIAPASRSEITEQNTITDLGRKGVSYSQELGALSHGSHGAPESKAASRLKWAWGLAIVSGAVAVGLGLGSFAGRPEASSQPSADPITVTSSAAARQAPSVGVVVASSASASASASASTEASAPLPRPSAKTAPSPRAAKASSVVRADDGRSCNPPYYEDAQGIRHIKPECLKFE